MGPILGMPQYAAGTNSLQRRMKESSNKESVTATEDRNAEDEDKDSRDMGDLLESDSDDESDAGSKWDEDEDPAIIHGGLEVLEDAVEGLNVNSWLLKDFLSDAPIKPSEPAKSKGKAKATTLDDGRTARVLGDADWKMSI